MEGVEQNPGAPIAGSSLYGNNNKGPPVEDSHNASEAYQAWRAERTAGVWESIKSNKRAVLWSMAISATLIMEGYDTILISSFYGYPTFQQKYGQYYPQLQSFQISSPWQVGINNSEIVGLVIGGVINGWASPRFGYKKTLLVSLAVLIATLFATFFAPSITVLLVGQLLNGVPLGVFATTGPAYASEVLPLSLRGYLATYCNLCFAVGQIIANGVLKAFATNQTQWSYRIPFAIQWVWPLPLIALLSFAPESPWFLLKSGRREEAAQALRRLADKSDDEIHATLAQMTHTIKLEQDMEAGTSYLDCLKGVDIRRTEIACLAWTGQVLPGLTLAYSATYFFISAGLSLDNAFNIGVGTNAISIVGTILSWWLMTSFGRRSIYLTGISILITTMLIIGVLSATTKTLSGLWAQAALLIVWHGVHSLTVGPIAFAIVAEISAIRLRTKTVVLARTVYNVALIFSTVIGPYSLNPSAWNWSGKVGFFWAGLGSLIAVWAFFRLPESKGRSYEELDMLFAQGTSARKFRSTGVKVYDETDSTNTDISTYEK
ncbi:general substrate transporter [Xylariaceae sp. FL1272]|nr:general substrate transporter [Xylariaceae sp. FL1272]